MERVFELIKNNAIQNGATEEFFEEMKDRILEACNYWITLLEYHPNHEEDVLVIGFSYTSSTISTCIAKYDAEKKLFVKDDQEFRALGWRPLPKTKFESENS